jgi:hypothetical protein
VSVGFDAAEQLDGVGQQTIENGHAVAHAALAAGQIHDERASADARHRA